MSIANCNYIQEGYNGLKESDMIKIAPGKVYIADNVGTYSKEVDTTYIKNSIYSHVSYKRSVGRLNRKSDKDIGE